MAERVLGKDSKLGEEVAELMNRAQKEEKKVLSSEMHEARHARHEARSLAKHQKAQHKHQHQVQHMQHAQASATSRTAMRQQEVSEALTAHQKFAAGEAKLANQGQQNVAEFAELKGAVAKAMAGGSSKDVEVAMEVGSLLDQATNEQKDVVQLEKKQAKETISEAHQLYKEKTHLMKEAKQEAKKDSKHATHALLQQEDASESLAKENAKLVMKAASRATHQVRLNRKLLSETTRAEDAIRSALRGRDAAKVRAQVLRMMEKARRLEKGVVSSEAKLAKRERRAAKKIMNA